MTHRPIITLNEWAATNGVKPITARKWATQAYLPAYRSPDAHGGIWLIPADTPVPPHRPLGTPSHKAYQAKHRKS